MAKTKKVSSEASRLQQVSQRATRLGFVFISVYVVSILIFTAWKLMEPDALQDRWIIAAVALAANTTLWLFSRQKNLSTMYYQGIIVIQILMYIGIATFSIYTQRGMASNAIILYAIPLVIAALSYSAKMLLAAAVACSAAYAGAAITYFKHYPSEGYKVELYGEIVFYCAVIFLLAALLHILARSRK